MADDHSPADVEKDKLETPSPSPLPESQGRRDSTALDVLRLVSTHDDAHPIYWSLWKKWPIVTIYCLLQVFVTLTSTTYVSAEFLIQERFPASTQVITLGQSMFIVGNAVGPAFLGPLADIGGRKWVYVISIFLYAVLNIGTALAYNLPMLIIFQFLCGAAGSTALSNVAGTIADLWADRDDAGQPMALFVLSANVGPSLGSPIGEWIAENPHMGWRWIFYINIIIGGVFAFAMIFVPETLPRIVISRAVKRHGSVDENALAIAAGSSRIRLIQEMRFVATMALRIMTTEPIVIFLALYNGTLSIPLAGAGTLDLANLSHRMGVRPLVSLPRRRL
jgi:multidrug resistance protein